MAKRWSITAVALFVGAFAWPTVAGALFKLTLSPYERALQNAWCGGALHESYALLGHCAACWFGSAILVTAAALVALASRAAQDNR